MKMDMEPAPAEVPQAAPPVPAPPRRRWKKVLAWTGIVLGTLLLAVILLGPLVIGAVAESKIPAVLGEMLDADVRVGKVSFRWSGRIEVTDLVVRPRREGLSAPLLEVKRVEAVVALGPAISGKYIASVEVIAPKVVVEKDARGKFNYEIPPRPESAKKEPSGSAPSEQPHVVASLRVREGEVRIRGRQETVYTNLDLTAKVDTLAKLVTYALSLDGPAQDKIRINGSLALEKIEGPATVTLEKVSLKNLTGAAQAYSPVAELDGTVSGTLDYVLKGAPRFTGRGRLEVAGFAAVIVSDRTPRCFKLDRLIFSHDGGLDDAGNGRHTIAIAAGPALDLSIRADVEDAFGVRAVKADVTLVSDLAALGTVLRDQGMLPGGFALEGKAKLVGKSVSKGPTAADLARGELKVPATWEVAIEGDGLVATLHGKPMAFDTLSVTSRGSIDERGNGTDTITLALGKCLAATASVKVGGALSGAPTLRAQVGAASDLAELGQALERMMGLKAGVRLAGKAEVKGAVELDGFDVARADLELAAKDVAAIDGEGRRQEIEKSATFRTKGAWEAKGGATLEHLSLASSFGSVEARGGFATGEVFQVLESSLVVKDVNLERLGAKLDLFLADPPKLAGTASATATFAKDAFDLQAEAAGVTVATKDRTIGPIDARFVQKGTFEARKGGALVVREARLTSGAVAAEVTGRIDRVMEPERTGTLQVEARVLPAELSKWMRGLSLGGPEVRLSAKASLGPKVVTITGGTRLDGLTHTVTDPATKKTVVRTARTRPVEFTATMEGETIVSKLSTALFEWIDPGYAVKGSLASHVTVSPAGIRGETRIADLEVEDEKKNVVKDAGVTFKHDLAFSADGVEIRGAEVSSSFLRGSVRGKIGTGDPLEFRDLAGTVFYHPDRLGAVLKPWLPGKLEGAEEKRAAFVLNGKARGADPLAILRGAGGTFDLDLARFTKDGLTVSGKTQARLEGGRLTSGTPLDVNRGRTTLDASLDFREETKSVKPASRLAFGAKDVDANADMSRMLEVLNPIFHVAKVGGTVAGKLTADFTLTWNGPIRADAADWTAEASAFLRGGGTFSARDLNIVGSPTVRAILEILGEQGAVHGELLPTEVAIVEDARLRKTVCRYANMTLRLARYELRFTGWVGLDRTMDLLVEMPMTEAMARRYPQLARYTQKTIFLKLGGTTAEPRPDVQGMLVEAAKRAVPALIEDKAKDLLEDLLKKKKKD